MGSQSLSGDLLNATVACAPSAVIALSACAGARYLLDRKCADMGSLTSQDNILQLVSWARNTMYESGCSRLCEFTYRPTKETFGNRGCGLGETEHDCVPEVGTGHGDIADRAQLSRAGEQFGGPVITRHWTRWQPTHPLKHAPDGRTRA